MSDCWQNSFEDLNEKINSLKINIDNLIDQVDGESKGDLKNTDKVKELLEKSLSLMLCCKFISTYHKDKIDQNKIAKIYVDAAAIYGTFYFELLYMHNIRFEPNGFCFL